MKKLFLSFLTATCGVALWAQTHSATPAADDQTTVSSGQLSFDGNARQLIYYGNVSVTNAQGKLTCERLTIDLPAGGDQHPTNVVAETNVVIDAMDNGQVKHITGDKAIYTYKVANAVTNEVITLTGHARYEDTQVVQTGEPIIWDCVRHHLSIANPVTHIKQSPNSANSTNASPFNFLNSK